MVPELGQVQGIISLGVLEAEVHSLVFEESDNVDISLVRCNHDRGELQRAALSVKISPGSGQCLEEIQVLILKHNVKKDTWKVKTLQLWLSRRVQNHQLS